jgi:proline iminopeptidase
MIDMVNSLTLFPEILPYTTHYLQVNAYDTLYIEECGNPNGFPVVFLHGGPGSGCNPAQRRFFDPNFYRIILFDQRGCGRSLPLGSVTENHTQALIADIEAIRIKLNIHQWLVFGGSWGSTLAICYAQAHPQVVSGLILRGIFLSRQSELNWFLGEIQHFYPDVWEKLLDYLPENERTDPLKAYSKRVFSEDTTISYPAATHWNAFETSIMKLIPKDIVVEPTLDKAQQEELHRIEVARARVQIHYIENLCFIDGDEVLKNCHVLKGIPTTIVQGRYDMVCPPNTAWQLQKAMPHAKLIMVPDAGHSAMEPGVVAALVDATERFKITVDSKNFSPSA